jgi:hypothetical protein
VVPEGILTPFESIVFARSPGREEPDHWDLRSTVEEMQAAGATCCAPGTTIS